MSHPTLTPEAKTALRRTIGDLRKRLLEDFRAAAESAYLLSVKPEAARLPEASAIRRRRLEGWLDEQVRTVAEPERKKKPSEVRERFLQQAVTEAASTLLNRLILLRIMEALSAGRPRGERLVAHDVVTKGWQSPAYKEFREFAPALCDDATEGYATLLGLMFDELALDLPGLYGDVGLTRLFPVPPATLRAVIEALNDPELETAWTDDTTLGWVYQYWNDPEREALDRKLNEGGKIEPHEIASKTQMFTERYMVEWLLQNSLGLQWLSICEKHGWIPDAKSVLDDLDQRRAAWRGKRDRGEVALDALMPIYGELEDRWKYYVPQPIPADMVAKAPESVRDLKILDPACGSGHFLVIAFDLLAALYREEARHGGEVWSDKGIAEGILENNLHGVDIDPRAVQIAAASLFVKARSFAREMRPKRVNLVAPALRLGRLPADDPALQKLRKELREEAGIPDELTNKLVKGLEGVDHLGTLLKVDKAIEEALGAYERVKGKVASAQGDLLTRSFPAVQAMIDFDEKRATVVEKLEGFLARHAREDEIGLRLHGEQIAAGVRFVRMVREGTYHIVAGNPPYQGSERLANPTYIKAHYSPSKADVYGAFIERAMGLLITNGLCAMVSLRGWLFLGVFDGLRRNILQEHDIRALSDLGPGAFESLGGGVVAPVLITIRRGKAAERAMGIRVDCSSGSRTRATLHRASLLAQVGTHTFSSEKLTHISGMPLVFWWDDNYINNYVAAPKLADVSPARMGMATSDNVRFLRRPWELRDVQIVESVSGRRRFGNWVPYIKGADGREWIEPLSDSIRWSSNGLEVKSLNEYLYGSFSRKVQNEAYYFRLGIAFVLVGDRFYARAHRFRSVFDGKGSSVYPEDISNVLCLLNATASKYVLQSLNPTVNFQVGDVNRLPVFSIANTRDIYSKLGLAFTEHEATRETSVEFKRPGPSPWRYAQDWAQRAVDRPAGEPLPPYDPVYATPEPDDFLSFAVGVALGRFGAKGEGILDTAPPDALPSGILYVSPTRRDSLDNPATALLRKTFAEQSRGDDDALRDWLRKDFWADHKIRYENRPIYFPFSSAKKTFVAWVSIHRFGDTTLQTLLADHLLPEQRSLTGEITDLRDAKKTTDKSAKQKAERRFADVQKMLEEINDFIAKVSECAEKGPPTPEKTTPREVDARFVMDLDDGVMINSAALYPLLEPQWKDPKKWWKELADAAGKKDYDWSHLAARYFPKRVDEKCRKDPSLAVAHRCFWRYHPEKAYAWELRLKDEIGPDFLIDEPDAAEHREQFLKKQSKEARAIEAKENQRRERKRRKEEGSEQTDLAYDQTGEGEGDNDTEELAADA